MARFVKGQKPPEKAGRKRGVSNKVTGDVRGMTLEALEQLGGKQYLIWLGIEHPREFASILRQCLPKEIKINAQNTVEIVTEVREMRERRKLEAIDGGRKAS